MDWTVTNKTMILEYILKHHMHDCLTILSDEDIMGYYSIRIDLLSLSELYPDIGYKILHTPIDSLPACNDDLVKAQNTILEQEEYKDKVSSLPFCTLKKNVFARFLVLPRCPEIHRTVFPVNDDLANLRYFLKISGTVVRVSEVKMLEYQTKYVCARCKHEHFVKGLFEERYVLKAPKMCENDQQKCKCTNFSQERLVSRELCKTYQEIKIQEQVNNLDSGKIPCSMYVVLENDLVDSCKPGDDVNICGTVRLRWRPLIKLKDTETEMVFEANFVEVCNARKSEVIANEPLVKECFDEFWTKYNQCPLKGRDHILAGVCPQVYGLHMLKLAVLLTVITGADHVIENDDIKKEPGVKGKRCKGVRGQCHLLLVGDPGTGKSQLLRAGSQLSKRSVFTSGAGSSKAGLTCAALREDGEWHLEAGALVLSNGGVCCIDEIGQLREHDRTAIHEAMEQQTISVAKAGIICKLNTRCAVIAACNPMGNYQPDEPLNVNVSLGNALLSRFDLIFILLDKQNKNKDWDKLVSSYLLHGKGYAKDKKHWNLEKLQMYISLVGPRETEMSSAAHEIIKSYYMMQRNNTECRDSSRTTVRMLDSLCRLSQAHCRLMYRKEVLPMDAIIAVSLVDLSMQDCTLNNTANVLHSTLSNHPDLEYLQTAKQLLSKLSLFEVWQQELLYYAKLLQIDHKTLEKEVERGSAYYFPKFDDVSEDIIPLTASLITSSYFDPKKRENKNRDVPVIKEEKFTPIKRKVTNEEEPKQTLKMPKPIIKDEKITPMKKVPSKRKRKDVTVDTSSFTNKNKKTAYLRKKKDIEDSIFNSEDENDPNKIYNAVPSVNDDFFADLGIEINFDDSLVRKDSEDINFISHSTQKNGSPINKNREIDFTQYCTQKDNHIEHSKKDDRMQQSSLSTIDKLKQFKFNGTHDSSKYEEDTRMKTKSVSETIIPLQNAKQNSNGSSSNQKSLQCSQVSIFESSDCDFDLDI